jgi:hypothetical protein
MKVQLLHSKRWAISSVGIVVFVLLAMGAWLYARPSKSWHTQNTCSDYNGASYDAVSPKNIKEFVGEAPGIVIGTVLNPEAYTTIARPDGPKPQLRIQEVIKGSDMLHVGDEIRLCPATGMMSFEDDNYTVAVFLEGQNNDYWVPERGYIGIVPQNEEARFETKMFIDPPRSFTAEDLRRLARQ